MSKNGTVKQAALSETLIICDFSFSQSKYSFLYLSILSIISHHILQIVWYYYITVYTNIFKKQVIIIIIVKMFYIALFTKLICQTQVIAFFKYMYVISANKCSVRVYMWSAANFQSDYWYLRVTMIISIHTPV